MIKYRVQNTILNGIQFTKVLSKFTDLISTMLKTQILYKLKISN